MPDSAGRVEWLGEESSAGCTERSFLMRCPRGPDRQDSAPFPDVDQDDASLHGLACGVGCQCRVVNASRSPDCLFRHYLGRPGA